MSAVRSQAGGPRPTAGAREPGLTRPGLAWRQATHRRAWAFALWLALAAAIGLPALLMTISAVAVESGLAETLAADGGFSVRQQVADVDAFNALSREVDARVAARTGSALVPLGDTASITPLHLVTVRTEPATPEAARQPLTAVYAGHLAAHVAVVAGELPAEGLGGGETAVAMSQAAADQLGLGPSDRLCAGFTPGGQARWCGRIVGLWRPLATDDPFWDGVPRRQALTMGRYDLFELAKLGPPRPPTAEMRYWAAGGAVAPGGAERLAGQVSALAADVRSAQRQVSSRLDASLPAFAARQRTAVAATHALAALTAFLGLAAVALVAGRFLDTQARELALLRARGWPRARAWRVAFLGMGAVGLVAAAAALGACIVAAATLSVATPTLSALSLRPADLSGMLLPVAVIAIALVVLLAVLAARAVWRDPDPSLRPPAEGHRTGRRTPSAVAAAAGVVAMLLPHLPGVSTPSAPARGLLLVLPAVGVVLLAAAAVALPPPAALVPGRDTVPGTLAGLQLRRRVGQHADAALVLALAAAGAMFAALAATVDQHPAGSALRTGLYLALAAGAAGGLLLALAGLWLHFRWAARRRLGEYGGLFAHGLDPGLVGRSLAAEQVATAGAGLLAGCVLGAGLALTVLPLPPAPGILAGLAAAAVLALVALPVASLSRRPAGPADPLRLQRRL
jgi:hypothetical protein